MKKFLQGRVFKIFLACMLIAAGISILRFVPGVSRSSELVDYIFAPMQQICGKIFSSAKEVLPEKEKSAEKYDAEIASLQEEVRRLRAVCTDYYNIKMENAQYEKFYEFKKKNSQFTFTVSNIIARNPNAIFGEFILDKGLADGISVNDPVMSENGLVGVVTAVSELSCKVKTIFSPDVKIGALDTATRDSGVISGSRKLLDEGLTAMRFISSRHKMNVDDIVVTTGLAGICPKDIPIGKVREVSHDEDNASFTAKVEPFDDFGNLITVFAIKDFAGKGEIDVNFSFDK